MGSYWIPSNKLKGEGRILFIFTGKSLAFTAVGAFIGMIFYLIFSVVGMKGVGVIIMAALAITGFGIATIKIPTFGNSKLVKNLGGESIDQIIYRYVIFKRNKKVYTYAVPRKEPKYGSQTTQIDSLIAGINMKGENK